MKASLHTFRLRKQRIVFSFLFSLMPVFCLHAGTFPQQQSQKESTLQAKGFSVAVDVVVTDQDNRVLRGLQPDAFRIYEDGVLQSVDSFLFLSEGSAPQTSTGSGKPGEATTQELIGPATEPPEAEKHCLILLLDLSSADLSGRKLLEDALTRFIQEDFQPGDCAAVFSLDPTFSLRQGFTEDRQKLLDAVQNLNTVGFTLARADTLSSILPLSGREPVLGTSSSFLKGAAEAPSEYQVMRLLDSGEFSIGVDLNTWRVFQQFLTMRTFISRRQTSELLQSVQAIARGVAPLGGRKTLVLVSHGFIVGSETDRDLYRTIEIANQANLAVYSIDPQGLEVHGTSSSVAQYGQMSSLNAAFRTKNAIGGDSKNAIGGESLFDRAKVTGTDLRESALRYLTTATGGFAVGNTNDLRPAFGRIYAESRSYYLLVYRPQRSDYDGTFRNIRVETDVKGAKVHHRQGYLAVPAGMENFSDEQYQLVRQVQNESLDRSLQAGIATHLFPTHSLFKRILISLEIPTGELTYTSALAQDGGNIFTTQLVLAYWITDADSGITTDAFSLPVNVHLTADERHSLPQLRFSEELPVMPGKYTIGIVLQDTLSKKARWLKQELEVPPSGTDIQLSEIVLGTEMQRSEGFPTLLTVDGATLIPSVRRVFTEEDRLIFYFQVCAGPVQEVQLHVSLSKAGSAERAPIADFSISDRESATTSCVPVARFIELSPLQPGMYSLGVEASDETVGEPVRKAAWFRLLGDPVTSLEPSAEEGH